MHFKIPHKMRQFDAVQKVKKALEDARPQLKDQAVINAEKWDGNTLNFDVTVQGKRITGTLEVSEADFIIDAKLPLLWRMFEGMIEKEIAKQIPLLK